MKINFSIKNAQRNVKTNGGTPSSRTIQAVACGENLRILMQVSFRPGKDSPCCVYISEHILMTLQRN